METTPDKQSTASTTAAVAPAAAASANNSGCFDCNICLDFAADPVVTLCGHLYCWPCIYKWLCHTESASSRCPVCKSPLSQDSLVPLYGRGQSFQKQNRPYGLIIPHRPRPQHEQSPPQAAEPPPQQFVYPSSSPVFQHSTVMAVLPWVLRSQLTPTSVYYTSLYHAVAGERRRRWEMEVERSLHQICLLLSVFAVLCLLLF